MLFRITTGDIVNQELPELFEKNFDYVNSSFREGIKFIKMDNDSVIIHE